VSGIEVIGLVLCIVEFNPGVGCGRVGTLLGAIPGRVRIEEDLVDDNNA
jgi:hypothetical protein